MLELMLYLIVGLTLLQLLVAALILVPAFRSKSPHGSKLRTPKGADQVDLATGFDPGMCWGKRALALSTKEKAAPRGGLVEQFGVGLPDEMLSLESLACPPVESQIHSVEALNEFDLFS
jgi:hypothetical protein